MKRILCVLWIFSLPLFSEEIRLSIGEKKYFYFPGLKKVENLNPKLIHTKIFPKKDEVLLQAKTKGNGKLNIRDQNGNHLYEIIVYSKLSLDYEREIEELTSAIEGIQVRSVGHKVMITGQILTPEDQKILDRIEKLYENVINLAYPMPSAKKIPPNFMVEMHVKFLEVDREDLRKLGIEFPEKFKAHVVSPHFLKTDLLVFLHTLEKKGWAKTIAEPTLVCNNHQKAKFLAGGEIPIRLTSRYQSSVEWKPYGVTLEIEPQIHSKQDLTTTLRIELSDLNQTQMLDGIPSLKTRRLKTSVRVEENQTIILSGLQQKQKMKTSQGLPLLSDIPILGDLFRVDSQTYKEVELMIFLTPKISLQGKP